MNFKNFFASHRFCMVVFIVICFKVFLNFLFDFIVDPLVFFFNYLFLAVLGLCYCMWAFSSCREWGLLFVAVHRLLIAVVSLVVEPGL